jgi:hypothetical protein
MVGGCESRRESTTRTARRVTADSRRAGRRWGLRRAFWRVQTVGCKVQAAAIADPATPNTAMANRSAANTRAVNRELTCE